QPRRRSGAAGGAQGGGRARYRPDLCACHDEEDAAPGMEREPRRGDRDGGAGAGDLHADAGLPARLRGVRRQAQSRVRRRLMDRFAPYDWPFFEPRHAQLAREAGGDAFAAFALSEPDAGSDVQAMSTTARRAGGGWTLNGTKTWISNGGIAHFYVVFAKADEGITAFVVDAADLDASERIEIVAPHPMATVRLRNSRAVLLGEPGQGFKLAMRNLDIFRTTVAAAALGLAR